MPPKAAHPPRRPPRTDRLMTARGRTGAAIAPLLVLLDTSYDKVSWHGVNLRGSLRRVQPEAAAWRPAADAHNVWELMVHAVPRHLVVGRVEQDQEPVSYTHLTLPTILRV